MGRGRVTRLHAPSAAVTVWLIGAGTDAPSRAASRLTAAPGVPVPVYQAGSPRETWEARDIAAPASWTSAPVNGIGPANEDPSPSVGTTWSRYQSGTLNPPSWLTPRAVMS